MTDMPLGSPGTLRGPAGPPAPSDEILVAFAEPAEQNRLTVLVRIILAIPHLIVLWALGIAAQVVRIVCRFAGRRDQLLVRRAVHGPPAGQPGRVPGRLPALGQPVLRVLVPADRQVPAV